MKIQVNTILDEYRKSEMDVYRQLAAHGPETHPGKKNVCQLRDESGLQGPH